MKNVTKSITIHYIAIVCIVLVWNTQAAIAQEQEAAHIASARIVTVELSEADVQFIKQATQSNTDGIRLAKLAQIKGSEAHVIELGKSLEEYHQKSLNALTTLAKLRNFSLHVSNTPESNDTYALLNDKSGNDFNKLYSDLTVTRLRDAVVAFENASARSNDLDIRTWSTTEIPPMRDQLIKSIACQQLCSKL
jgi:putative membrane protein